jgi:hypothetical protein
MHVLTLHWAAIQKSMSLVLRLCQTLVIWLWWHIASHLVLVKRDMGVDMAMATTKDKQRRVMELLVRKLMRQQGMKFQLRGQPIKQQLTQQRRRQRQHISEAARVRSLFVIYKNSSFPGVKAYE